MQLHYRGWSISDAGTAQVTMQNALIFVYTIITMVIMPYNYNNHICLYSTIYGILFRVSMSLSPSAVSPEIGQASFIILLYNIHYILTVSVLR